MVRRLAPAPRKHAVRRLAIATCRSKFGLLASPTSVEALQCRSDSSTSSSRRHSSLLCCLGAHISGMV